MNSRRLYRNREDKQIAGVCGGLADYFNIDAGLVRLGFVLMALLGGSTGIVLYIIMWLFIPQVPDDDDWMISDWDERDEWDDGEDWQDMDGIEMPDIPKVKRSTKAKNDGDWGLS